MSGYEWNVDEIVRVMIAGAVFGDETTVAACSTEVIDSGRVIDVAREIPGEVRIIGDRDVSVSGVHHDPHSLLGPHAHDGGVTVRTLRPWATAAWQPRHSRQRRSRVL